MNSDFNWADVACDAAQNPGGRIVFGKGPAYVADVIGTASMVYLASPYSKRCVNRMGKWDLGLSGRASADAARAVGALKDVGVSAFSPIVQSAEVVHATLNPFRVQAEPAPQHDPLNAEGWLRWCMPFLYAAYALVIPDIEGWDQSSGIKAEVVEALLIGIPIIIYAKG